MFELDRTPAPAPKIDIGEILTGHDSHDKAPRPTPRRGHDLRHLAADRAAWGADRAVRGRPEPRVVRNIPRRRGY